MYIYIQYVYIYRERERVRSKLVPLKTVQFTALSMSVILQSLDGIVVPSKWGFRLW